ncbi:MAG: methionine adenosyltransferase domain-containing protein [Patescibacteria group bacterium]
MLKAVEAPLAGHPDKVCDLLVESVVDEYLRRDLLSKMDIQALGSNGMVMLGGVVDSRADFDVAEIAKQAYVNVGYTEPIELFVNLERPSEERLRAPRTSAGASGTAIVYGYATRETREMMPRSVVYANALARRIDDLRRTDTRFSWLRPDGKVQLAMRGEQVVSVTIIAAHAEDMDINQVQTLLLEHAVAPVLGSIEGVKVFINPVGPFTTGGFTMNAGVSGRKILSDTYGGLLPHGGVAMVGKDPLKPSRAGAYMTRFAAREIVKEGLASNVLITAVYSVGLEEPVSLFARGGDGTDLSRLVSERFDFRSEAIVERFNLRRPMYAACANYGMFGREGVPWEE